MIHLTRRLFAASALALAAPLAWAQATGPIKIGLMLVDSGPFAFHAAFMEEGARAALDIINAEGGAVGRKFELKVQKHSGTPATATR